MARVRTADEDDRLTRAVVRHIGEPAVDLVEDPATTLVAVADSIADGPAVGGLLARGPVRWELRTTAEGDPAPVLAALVAYVGEEGGGPLNWFVPAAVDDHRRAAAGSGLLPSRALFQMRRALPPDEHAEVEVRSFDPPRDRESWLAVNNRAFAGHPDQGSWSDQDLRRRESEPWFDPAGFLLHEIDGRLAAFCWTKVHAEHDPPLGEIYVIAVDPDFHGRGLGRELSLAGLDHLAARGLRVGMLYVEADNEAALGLYRRLGFVTHHEDVFFTGTVPPP